MLTKIINLSGEDEAKKLVNKQKYEDFVKIPEYVTKYFKT